MVKTGKEEERNEVGKVALSAGTAIVACVIGDGLDLVEVVNFRDAPHTHTKDHLRAYLCTE